MNSGMRPSQVFRRLLQQGVANSAPDIVNLLYEEFDDLSPSAMPAVMSWNRRTNADRAGTGISDDRLDEILLDILADVIDRREADSSRSSP